MRAYILLKHLQGKRVARFFGYFRAEFPVRELEEDRQCHAILLEGLDGEPLDEVATISLPTADRLLIRKQILETVVDVYARGVFLPNITSSNFLVIHKNGTPRMVGFSNSFDPATHDLSAEQRKADTKTDIEDVDDM